MILTLRWSERGGWGEAMRRGGEVEPTEVIELIIVRMSLLKMLLRSFVYYAKSVTHVYRKHVYISIVIYFFIYVIAHLGSANFWVYIRKNSQKDIRIKYTYC